MAPAADPLEGALGAPARGHVAATTSTMTLGYNGHSIFFEFPTYTLLSPVAYLNFLTFTMVLFLLACICIPISICALSGNPCAIIFNVRASATVQLFECYIGGRGSRRFILNAPFPTYVEVSRHADCR